MTQQVSESSTDSTPAEAADKSDSGLRVLIAEDEALIRLDLKEMLTRRATTSSARPPTASRRSSSPRELAPGSGHPGRQDAQARRHRGGRATIAAGADRPGRHPHRVQPARPGRAGPRRGRDGLPGQAVREAPTCVPAIEMAVSRFAEIKALEDEVARRCRSASRPARSIDRAKGLLMTAARDDRAGRLPLDPADRDGPPHDDEGGRRGRRRRAGNTEVLTPSRGRRRARCVT